MKIVRKIIENLWIVLILLFMYQALILKQPPSLGKYSVLHVISPSMEPTIMTNDVVVVEKLKPTQDIIVDDVYIYRAIDQNLIIHRIIGEQENSYEFKGDNNPVSDPFLVPRSQILYKQIFTIPMLGYLILLVKNVYFMGSVILLYIGWYLYQNRKKAKKEPTI